MMQTKHTDSDSKVEKIIQTKKFSVGRKASK